MLKIIRIDQDSAEGTLDQVLPLMAVASIASVTVQIGSNKYIFDTPNLAPLTRMRQAIFAAVAREKSLQRARSLQMNYGPQGIGRV